MLDELRAVAVADEGAGAPVAWHPAQVVFARRDDPSQMRIAERYLSTDLAEHVAGPACTRQALDHDVAEGLLRRIEPLDVPSFHRIVCGAEGSCEVVPRDELLARRHRALAASLQEAVRLAKEGSDAEAVTEAFDAAWDVDPWSLESNLLRCGWRVRDATDDDAVEDLLRTWPDPSDFKAVGSHAIWTRVAGARGSASRRFCDDLLRAAREAAEELLAPRFELAPPIAEAVLVKATLLGALRRRWGLSQPAALDHDELAAALRGAPEAMARVDERLQVSREWRLWTELIDRAPSRALAEMQQQLGPIDLTLGRARREDLLGVARTWNTLESNAEERADRHGRWRSALARLGAWSVRDVAPWRQGEQLANAVRERWRLDERPIGGVFDLLREEFGVRVDGAELGDADASVVGALPRRSPPCVFLGRTSKHDPLASRFAAAHELAHLLLAGRSTRRDESWYCATGGDPAHDDQERLANAFAVYLLAPREQVQQFVQRAPPVRSPEFVAWALRVRARYGLTAVTAGEHMLNCVGRPEEMARLPDDVRAKLGSAPKEPTPFDARDVAPPIDAASGRSQAFRATLERCVAIGAVQREQAREVLPRAVA